MGSFSAIIFVLPTMGVRQRVASTFVYTEDYGDTIVLLASCGHTGGANGGVGTQLLDHTLGTPVVGDAPCSNENAGGLLRRVRGHS